MKKFWIQIAILLIVALGSMYLFKNQGVLVPIVPGLRESMPQKQLKINETVITVDIANTPDSRRIGLGEREKLDSNAGMLFTYSEKKVYQFWMKGMKFPLDFIFIRDGEIVDILKNISPPTSDQPDSMLPIYQPTQPIDMLLEVNAGFADLNNIKVGDKIFLAE